jgi:hypothetical protein
MPAFKVTPLEECEHYWDRMYSVIESHKTVEKGNDFFSTCTCGLKTPGGYEQEIHLRTIRDMLT